MRHKSRIVSSTAILLVCLGALVLSASSSELEDEISNCRSKPTLNARVTCYTDVSLESSDHLKSDVLLDVTNDLFRAENYIDAVQFITLYIDSGGTNSEAFIMRGIVNSQLGNLDQAIDDLTHAIESGRRDEFIFAERGHIRLKKGDFAKAIEDFTKELTRVQSFELLEARGDAYVGLGEFDKAVSDYRGALVLRGEIRHRSSGFSPSEVQLYMKLLALLRDSGRMMEYSDVRDEAIRRNPGSRKLHDVE